MNCINRKPPYPSYPKLHSLIFPILFEKACITTRSFRKDAIKACGRVMPPIEVHGVENIPEKDTLSLITINHYSRYGFDAWWIALAVSAAVPQDIHWIMTSSWTCQGKWYGFVVKRVTGILFRMIAEVYDFTNMPPMPPSSAEFGERVIAMKKVISKIRNSQISTLAIAPEGRDFPGGILGPTPKGVGRFIQFISRLGFKVIPIGIYEDAGYLHVNIGENYSLPEIDSISSKDIDSIISNIVMNNIALLLPHPLRGEYVK